MNMKNVMVALAAAMLVPALAPTAAAAATCSASALMEGSPALYAQADTGLAADGGSVEFRIGSEIGEETTEPVPGATYRLQRGNTDLNTLQISVWKKAATGCVSTAVIPHNEATALTFEIDSGATYFLYVENVDDVPRDFEALIVLVDPNQP